MSKNSIEQKDKELFDRIANKYAKKDQINYCRVARKLRLDSTLRNTLKPINSVLEIGCGCGYTINYLPNQINKFVGIDYSKELIKYAKRYNSKNNVEFICQNIKDFQSKDKFSVILMIGVLHHVPEPKNLLLHIKQFLKKDGAIIINEPQRGNPIISFLRYIRKQFDKDYSSDQVEFSEQELISMFEDSGFNVNVFPQGFLTTPFAESTFIPRVIGLPVIYILRILDQFFERIFNNKFLRKLAWNIIVQAKLMD